MWLKTHPCCGDAFLSGDAVEFDTRPGRRRGALLFVRDVASLQSSHLGAIRRRLFSAETVRDNLKFI